MFSFMLSKFVSKPTFFVESQNFQSSLFYNATKAGKSLLFVSVVLDFAGKNLWQFLKQH